MAAINVLHQELYEVHTGQVGYREIYGTGNFSTTDATGTIAVSPLLSVFEVFLTPATAPNTDEQLYCTAGSDGKVAISSGAITVGRTGTKTSALKFNYRIKGR